MKRLLTLAWNRWKQVTHVIGAFQSRFILTVFYFIPLLPLGLIGKFFMDPLKLKTKQPKMWLEHPAKPDLAALKDQY